MMNLDFARINVVEIFPWKGVAVAALSFTLGTNLFHAEAAQSAVFGDSVTTVNTFEDSVITGGLQTVFGIEGPVTITDEVELPNFIGFYDIDVNDTSLSLTLVDNSGATDLILPADRYDRYYFEFDTSTITSASLDGSAELNEFANVDILEAGFSLDAADLFSTGIPVPIEFENGGLLLEFSEGTDLTNLGISAKVNFTSQSVPEPQAAIPILLAGGLMGVSSITRKHRSI
ncbi:MAG: hypothetical protein AAGL17_18950 [Cyanobacteria bacterium J06576_12]